MSPRARSKNPPVATRRKRLLHAFYLAQPFLQFFALMAVLFVLGRCSPLAPSTEKSALNKTTSAGAVATHNENGDNSASETDIQTEMRDVSRWEEMPVISQSDLAGLEANAIDADTGADLARVNKFLNQRTPQHNVRLLAFHLDEAQRQALFRGEPLRIDLVQRLSAHMNADARRALFGGLHRIMPNAGGNLSAKAYLVLPGDDGSSDVVGSIPVATRFQLAIFSTEDRAWLQVSRQEQNLDDQQKKLIESNISRPGAFVVLTLE